MKEYNTGRDKKEKREYPPKLALVKGKPVAAQYASEPREYEGQKVLEVECPDGKTYTLWWPRELVLPPVLTPFLIEKTEDGVTGKKRAKYRLVIPENDAEREAVWKTPMPEQAK